MVCSFFFFVEKREQQLRPADVAYSFHEYVYTCRVVALLRKKNKISDRDVFAWCSWLAFKLSSSLSASLIPKTAGQATRCHGTVSRKSVLCVQHDDEWWVGELGKNHPQSRATVPNDLTNIVLVRNYCTQRVERCQTGWTEVGRAVCRWHSRSVEPAVCIFFSLGWSRFGPNPFLCLNQEGPPKWVTESTCNVSSL
jgi:hypothetical protein